MTDISAENNARLDDILTKAQVYLGELEREIALNEKRAEEREVSAREFRSCFRRYRNKRDWRAIFDNIEEAIQTNEREAAECRDAIGKYREEAERARVLLTYHAAQNIPHREEH